MAVLRTPTLHAAAVVTCHILEFTGHAPKPAPCKEPPCCRPYVRPPAPDPGGVCGRGGATEQSSPRPAVPEPGANRCRRGRGMAWRWGASGMCRTVDAERSAPAREHALVVEKWRGGAPRRGWPLQANPAQMGTWISFPLSLNGTLPVPSRRAPGEARKADDDEW